MAGPIDPRLLKLSKAVRNYLVASVVVGLLTAGLLIAQAGLLARAISHVFRERALPENWWVILAGLAAVFTGRAVLTWLNETLAQRSAASVKSQLRRDVLSARLARPRDSATSSASMIKVVTTGLDDLDGYFAKYLPQLGLAATVPFLVGGAILLTDWQSAIIVAFTLPLIPVFMALVGWTTETATRKSFAVADRLANHFADLIEGLPTLQAFARARAQRRGVELGEEKYRSATMRVLYVSFLSALALELLASLSVAVVAVTVGFRLVYGDVSFETALFVLILAPEAFLPVRQVGVHFHDSADGAAAADAAFNFIDAGALGSGTAPVPTDRRIRFDNVDYTYPGSDSPALDRFNLTIEPGEVLAVRGTSGGGKSTALALLMGFLHTDAGTVSVGGTNLREVDQRAWRRELAWVAQEPGMVNGTVATNVRLGHPGASDEDVALALRDAGANFDGTKSVGDDGEGLSAGERRRVALARALLRIRLGGAKLLVLDEPTAGLDSSTEAAAIAAVRASGVGAVIVTHRPAVIAAADRVVQLGATS
ncbi:MAG: thiol reductant ABC exporter subunit CydD [Arachnia sp.]